MKKLEENHSLILGIVLLCAVGCYFIGFSKGTIVFIVLGAILEIAFWCGFFTTYNNSDDSTRD